jgi:hypothetical protein
MALSVVQKQVLSLGSAKGVISTITFDSSYPTGGEDLLAADLGLSQVHGLVPMIGSGYNFQFNQSTGKLLAFNGTSQIANSTNLSTLVVDVLAIGT